MFCPNVYKKIDIMNAWICIPRLIKIYALYKILDIMSLFRSYLPEDINPRRFLPEFINNTIMFYTGRTMCFFQYYINNTFSASEITDRLFVGDLASATNIDAMKEQGITHIVSVFNGSYEMYDDFKYKIVHINDDPWVDIGSYFNETNEFIDAALSQPSTRVMIHCQKGVSRSVTLLMAYILFKRNQIDLIECDEIDDTIDMILADVKNHRPIADPNEGFINSLRTYVRRLNGYPIPSVGEEVVADETNKNIDTD